MRRTQGEPHKDAARRASTDETGMPLILAAGTILLEFSAKPPLTHVPVPQLTFFFHFSALFSLSDLNLVLQHSLYCPLYAGYVWGGLWKKVLREERRFHAEEHQHGDRESALKEQNVCRLSEAERCSL